MDRHPSHPARVSVPSRVRTGLARTVKGTAPSARSSETGTSITARRRRRWTWGAAKPTPSYWCRFSFMSSMRRWISGEPSSSPARWEAEARTTGWPMRATLRIDTLLVELVAVARHDLDHPDRGIPQDLEPQRLAGPLPPDGAVELAERGDGGAVD